MIRYTLVCAADHDFESWFRDSEAFDTLAAAGQVACPACGSVQVRKALMAPSVVTSRAKVNGRDEAARAPEGKAPQHPAPHPAGPVALLDERARQLRRALRDIHRRVMAESENVGRTFAQEARAMHDGTAPERAIHGEATRDEVEALLEDNIPVLPIPVPPDDHH